MISDLLPSAGDERDTRRGKTELQSFTAKQATLTHTHTPFLTLHPFHLPYLPLRATERGVPLLTKSQASSRESLRRTTPTTTTASETLPSKSTPPPTPTLPPPRYQYPRKERPHQQHSAFQSPGSFGGENPHPSPRPLAAGAPSAVSKRTQDTHPDSR